MNKRLAILAAAATVAIGASSYAQDNTSNTTAQQQNQSQQQQQIDTQNPTGTNTARGQVAPDKKEISGVLGQISAAAVKGQYSDVAERFTKEDRDRLKYLKDDKSAANWDDFKKNWKNKYGKDFDDDKAQAAFNGGTAAIQILSGDLEARTASERMQPGQSSRSGQAAQTGQTGSTTGDNTNTTGSNPNDTTSGTGATGNANSNGVSGGASVGGVGERLGWRRRRQCQRRYHARSQRECRRQRDWKREGQQQRRRVRHRRLRSVAARQQEHGHRDHPRESRHAHGHAALHQRRHAD